MTIDRKIRVFISSKCGGYYTIVRKALQVMLEESGLCDVYAFETDYSLSCPVVSAYLDELADSDVIIVFVDNKDGVTDPVQSEINRARELNKKILFFFCDEYKKEETVLQKYLRESLLEKYKVCHEFSDFPKDAYNSFFNDITKLYRHSDSEVTDIEDVGISISSECDIADFKQIKKDNLKSINSVKQKIKKMSGICFLDEANTLNELDAAFNDLFSVVIGEKNIQEVDFSPLEKHWAEIYNKDLDAIIKARKEALINYLSGKYQESFDIMEQTIAEHRDNMPHWLLNDIAIDLRNIDSLISNRKGVWAIQPKGQCILDEDEECIFNPLIDRFNSDFYQELVKIEVNNKIESPDTVIIGSDDKVFDCLANTFIAAVDCISITHILLIRSKLSKLFAMLSFRYREHSLFINVVKMLVLDCNEKELRKYFTKYGESTNLISSSDVLEIQDIVDKISDDTKRLQSQSLLLEFFAYYYDDLKFECVKEKYFVDAKKAIERGQIVTFSFIIRVLSSVDRRVCPDEILSIIYLIIDSKYKRYYDDALKAIKDIATLSELKKKDQKELIRRLKSWLSDKPFADNCPSILDATQSVRLSLGKQSESLDKYVQKYSPRFYERPYSVNVYNHTNTENAKYVLELIKSIREQNKTQGVGGAYSQYAYNDYSTIGNILQNSAENPLDSKYVNKIIPVIAETLYAKTQTCEAKFSALRLLILMQMIYPKSRNAKKLLMDIKDFSVIKAEHEFSMQNRYTNDSLLVMWELARMYICGETSDAFITELHGCAEAEQIAVMDSLCILSRPIKNVDKDRLIKIIWPSLLLFEVSDSKRMRFFLSIIYANLYDTSFCGKALKRLIILLENGTSSMKIGAISRLKARKADGDLVEYLYQQGRVDNHYCVRKVANR